MSTRLLNIYHKLPPVARVVIASLEGYKLRNRRYGSGFTKHVSILRQRQSWTRSDWDAYQKAQLDKLLERAVHEVQHYRRAVKNGRHTAKLSNWPFLEKEVLRQHPLALVRDGCNPASLIRVYTSGTTGSPLQILRSRSTEQTWYAMFEVRARNLWGVEWQDRWAILGGRLVTPNTQNKPPFWVTNWGMKQLYMSSYHLSERFADAYLGALTRFRPAYLWAYTSSLFTLAQFILEAKLTKIRPKVIITNAEPLYEHQKATIAEAFQCPVVETYGMTEMAIAAVRCQQGYLHTWPDLGYLELLSDHGEAVAPGEIGHVVCTTLLNQDQPLIRYKTGDLAIAMPSDFECLCGNSAPALLRIEGRSDDNIITNEGKRIGRLDPVFKKGLHIKEAQIVQEEIDRFIIRYVPASGYMPEEGSQMISELKARIGVCSVELVPVEQIERTNNGKFKAVVSCVNYSNGHVISSSKKGSIQ